MLGVHLYSIMKFFFTLTLQWQRDLALCSERVRKDLKLWALSLNCQAVRY